MPQITTNNKRIYFIKLILLSILSLLFFSSSSGFFLSSLIDDSSYYGHGSFILIAFIWIARKRFRESREITNAEKKNSDLSGLIIICFSVLLYLTGIWGFINTFQSIAIYLFILGNFVFFFGSGFVLSNPGIFIYLLLAIPIPKAIIDSLTFDLQLIASHISEIILSLIYPSTVRYGNILNIKGSEIIITPACSGLQNLIGMISLTFFLALFQSNRRVKFFDYIIAVPAALLSNILRIIIVCILAVSYDRKFALEDWHEEIGIIMFLFIFIVISLFNESPLKKISAGNKSILPFLFKKNKFINLYLIIMSLLLLISFFIPDEFNTVKPDDGKILNNQIPKIIGKWHSEDFQIEDNYFTILGTNDILMRGYYKKVSGDKNETMYLFITRSKQNRRFAHPPHACLQGEGYNLIKEESINLSVNKEIIPCNRALFSRNNSGLLVYYWFNSNNINYNNLLSLYFSFLFMENRRSGGSMIRLSCVVNPDDPAAGEKLMQQFVKEGVPEILKSL